MADNFASVQKRTVPAADQAAPKTDIRRKELRIINLVEIQFGDCVLDSGPKE
jgi:hypothetical protein